MASAAAPLRLPGLRLVDLRELRGNDLSAALEEQTRFWRERFFLDFTPSAKTIRRFLDMRNLPGCALVWSGRPVGYSYCVREESKTLIGEFYIQEDFREAGAESRLFASTLLAAATFPGVRRIEGQLLALRSLPDARAVFGRPLAVYPRCFMLREAREPPPAAAAPPAARFSGWSDYLIDPAAELLATAYAGHVDSRINDQYRTFTGARRLLLNSIQHPGCGRFLRRAAVAAGSIRSLKLRGICLGSLVAADVGHIAQLCVDPEMRGRGLGRELLRRSLCAFHDAGSRAVSLTVTAANREAVRLYERAGFRTVREFPAFVWEA